MKNVVHMFYNYNLAFIFIFAALEQWLCSRAYIDCKLGSLYYKYLLFYS